MSLALTLTFELVDLWWMCGGFVIEGERAGGEEEMFEGEEMRAG